MIKIQIKSILGNVLFEYEKENNTIKDTVEQAIKSYADLRYADLRSANLRSANLRYADLRYADLRSADLRSADLRSANLSSADLRSADLSSADLRSADLQIHNKWTISYKDNLIVIGCKSNTIEGWDAFFNSNEVYSTERGTKDFAKIEASYLAYKAYMIHMDNFMKTETK